MRQDPLTASKFFRVGDSSNGQVCLSPFSPQPPSSGHHMLDGEVITVHQHHKAARPKVRAMAQHLHGVASSGADESSASIPDDPYPAASSAATSSAPLKGGTPRHEDPEAAGSRVLSLSVESSAKSSYRLSGSLQQEANFRGIKMKYITLILLIIQTVATIAFIRYSKTMPREPGELKFLNQAFVFVTEISKLFISFFLLVVELGLIPAFKIIDTEFLRKPKTTLSVSVVAALYYFQNNLVLLALENLSGAVYQVTYQLKILTTALLSVLILKKHLGLPKWAALFALAAGVALIQLPSASSSAVASQGNRWIGFAAVLTSCLTSGFAGVWLEKILKDSKASIWLRNIQLASLSCLLAMLGLCWSSFDLIVDNGLLQGFNWATWVSITFQSLGGIIVAAVLKYADNILKCFANAVAIILSCLVSWLGYDFSPTLPFLAGSLLVIWATYQYATDFCPKFCRRSPTIETIEMH